MDLTYAGLRGLVVLVVEDDWLLRQELFETLSKAGCKVLEASTGEYAVMLFDRDQQIDLLIADIQLAGPLDGWDIAERGRAVRPELPVVYTSGNCVLESRQVPGSHFHAKPCSMPDLMASCSELCRVK